jgi:hypothetical protein
LLKIYYLRAEPNFFKMKKILSIMLVAGVFALTACGGEEEKEEENEEETKTENVEKAPETETETAPEEPVAGAKAHACDDKCAEACTGPRCGEEGHDCEAAGCAAHKEGDHEHSEGDDHDHADHDKTSSEG